MIDVFSRERPADCETGRIAKVGKTPQALRVRSVPLWVGVHWHDGPVLCAGQVCPMCEAGSPRRPKAWLAVDRPNGTFASLEVTPSDIARFDGACAASGLVFGVGVSFVLRRSGERQPLTVDSVKFTPNLGEVLQDIVLIDVLRFHGVYATPASIAAGDYKRLVVNRAREISRRLRGE